MAAAGTIPNKGTGPIMLENAFYKLIKTPERDLNQIITFERK